MATPTTINRVEQAFAAACLRLAPLRRSARLLLGCSAGGDSMALLDLAARASAAHAWQLGVAHYDHAQRAESAAEAAFVREQTLARGLIYFGARYAGEAGDAALSEETMRQLRHASWRRAAHAFQADAIMLAHQADDVAETLLIRLLAGSGPTGLGAIRPMQRIMVSEDTLTLVRPLLDVRREDLRLYLMLRQLEWRDDPSNESRTQKRGWVRHELLPMLTQALGGDPTERIARAAALIGEEAQALSRAAEMLVGQLRRPAPSPASEALMLDEPPWRDAPALLRRQILRAWLKDLRAGASGGGSMGLAALEQVCSFVAGGRRGAHLRTVGRMHLVHCGRALLAFDPGVPRDVRTQSARAWMDDNG